jgi:hypothetical protein
MNIKYKYYRKLYYTKIKYIIKYSYLKTAFKKCFKKK